MPWSNPFTRTWRKRKRTSLNILLLLLDVSFNLKCQLIKIWPTHKRNAWTSSSVSFFLDLAIYCQPHPQSSHNQVEVTAGGVIAANFPATTNSSRIFRRNFYFRHRFQTGRHGIPNKILYFVKFLRLEQDKRSKNWFDLFDPCAGKNVIFTFKQIFSITPLHLKLPRFKWLQSDPTGGSILISIESPA